MPPVGHRKDEGGVHPSQAGFPDLTVSTPLLWGLPAANLQGPTGLGGLSYSSFSLSCGVFSPPHLLALLCTCKSIWSHSHGVWNCPIGDVLKFFRGAFDSQNNYKRRYSIQLGSRAKDVASCDAQESQTAKNHPSGRPGWLSG